MVDRRCNTWHEDVRPRPFAEGRLLGVAPVSLLGTLVTLEADITHSRTVLMMMLTVKVAVVVNMEGLSLD